MNAQAILVKIEQDAAENADRILREARAKADELLAASGAKIEGLRGALLKQAEKDGAELEQRMQRMAELEDRKLLLGQKRKLIDRAFELAYAKLLAAPAAERRAFFLRQVTAGAAGHETLAVGETACDWFDDGFLADANRSLAEKGKPGALTLAAKRVPGCAGVVLTTRGAEVRCTFEALIEEARAGLEQQVADTLFPAQ